MFLGKKLKSRGKCVQATVMTQLGRAAISIQRTDRYKILSAAAKKSSAFRLFSREPSASGRPDVSADVSEGVKKTPNGDKCGLDKEKIQRKF